MPTTAVLRERLEKLSDQWDAALVCKITAIFDVDSAADRFIIQTCRKQDDELIPYESIFLGTKAECQSVVDGLEAGTFTLRDVRQPDFVAPVMPEQKYIYRMDANPRMVGADDQHFIQAYEQTNQQTLIPGPVLFVGRADVCTGLLERLNTGTLNQDDFFTVNAARVSCYTTKDGAELDAFIGQDYKVYMGRRDHYDNRGHYLNDDKSLIHISDTDRVFDVISGSETPYTHAELLATGYFSQEEFERFTALQFNEPKQSHDYAVEPLDTTLDEYPLPDTSLASDNLKQYGYSGDDLLAVSKNRAAELLDQDMTVYMVQTGENPEMVFDRDDLMEQPEGMMFAIPREEWESSQDFQDAVADRMNHQEDREAAFLNHAGDCFAIYQLRDGEETRNLRYMPLPGQGVDKAFYELAYTGELAPGQDLSVLDKLWEKFNAAHPADYHRPSMSMSDIVAIKQDGVVSCHYCDRIGFTKVHDFIRTENYLQSAEMSVEDDYGMIDGIINNGPKATVAELEQQARSGQPISLMDWSDAVHRERGEKKSVLARLNAKPSKQNHKKSAPKKSAEKER